MANPPASKRCTSARRKHPTGRRDAHGSVIVTSRLRNRHGSVRRAECVSTNWPTFAALATRPASAPHRWPCALVPGRWPSATPSRATGVDERGLTGYRILKWNGPAWRNGELVVRTADSLMAVVDVTSGAVVRGLAGGGVVPIGWLDG